MLVEASSDWIWKETGYLSIEILSADSFLPREVEEGHLLIDQPAAIFQINSGCYRLRGSFVDTNEIGRDCWSNVGSVTFCTE